MAHRGMRSRDAKIRRKAKQIIIDNSHRCRTMAETISKLSKLDVLVQLQASEPAIPWHTLPNVLKGEVLIDARGRGSWQHG